MDGSIRIQLLPPSTQWRDSFLRALQEFRDEGLPWWLGPELRTAEQDFEQFVEMKLADSHRRTQTLVPKTRWWAISEERFVGRIAVHHELNDALRLSGGHVGYDTVPSYRGRGVATEMLRQVLPLARTLGLSEVLLTCDDDNLGSHRVIEKNGGSLRETKTLDPSRASKRYYWIAC